jgi:hypothetical protein
MCCIQRGSLSAIFTDETYSTELSSWLTRIAYPQTADLTTALPISLIDRKKSEGTFGGKVMKNHRV